MGDYNILQSGHFYDSEVDKNTFGSFFVVVTMFSQMPPKFVKTLSHK